MPAFQTSSENNPYSDIETSTPSDAMSNEERASGGGVSAGEGSVSAEEALALFGNFTE